MSGNSVGVDRLPGAMFRHLDNDSACCERCGGWLPDHEWADLDEHGTVVDCSEQAR